ncbi:MAG: ATP-binding cassette domain-containing protein [Alphaproteobacteria bacterium]|nr:ATP-binding cassette domain-containing protein [Alphaproteobacteria bacterium]
MLHIENITYRIAGRILLNQATVTINEGIKAAIVGRNGTGKTTLLRIINGDLQTETGSIRLRKNVKKGSIAQITQGDEISPIETVLTADTEREALFAEAENSTDPYRIADIHTRLADINAYTAEARACSILYGLGFSSEAQKRPCSSFSGGWRNRIALASILFSEPHLLLLDEPSNYLDLEGVLWLQNYITRYPGTVLLVSHNRDLINSTADLIIHLEQGKLVPYVGHYDNFEQQRRERYESSVKLQKKQSDEYQRIQNYVERFRYKASKAQQAQSRLKKLARMQPVEIGTEQQVQPFSFPDPQTHLPPPLVQINDVFFGYEAEKPILKNLNLCINPGDRIALLGQNGNGKSTLAKLIAGKLSPDSGHINRYQKLKIAYFSQNQVDELTPSETPHWHVRQHMPNATETAIRSRVASIGLDKNKMDVQTRCLSGGEQVRLLLGLITLNGPHLLILDEPTNHLDIDSCEALAQALFPFKGAVILISHDRHFIDSCADELWLIENNSAKLYAGNIDEYQNYVLRRSRTNGEKKSKNDSTERKKTQINDTQKNNKSPEKKQNIAKIHQKISKSEKEMDEIRNEIKTLEKECTEGRFFEKEYKKGIEKTKQHSNLIQRLAQKEENYLSLVNEVEEMERKKANPHQ